MKKISILAYAKINLFLDITKKRKDGYHNIVSYMQSVTLCDELRIAPNESGGISITCDNPNVPTGESNLVFRAAQKYFEYCGESFGVEIDIKKRIPMAAGLAGGSSDAAATLIALNQMGNKRLSEEQLCYIGAQIGADVPFCVVGGAMMAHGIGEILDKTKRIPKCTILIACGGNQVSTVSAYGELDKKYNNFDTYSPKTEEFNQLIEGCYEKSLDKVAKGMFNIFESVVVPKLPSIENIKNTMLKQGAKGAMMSGSGASVFGLFADDESAKHAQEELKKENIFAKICYTVN